ncbi:MAG TPA: hypothetical protein VFM74_01400, partial [Candidatus Limnocylindria bacterium]|nr:hypothetical protein [Candidatus Limnocylindria bacterium]
PSATSFAAPSASPASVSQPVDPAPAASMPAPSPDAAATIETTGGSGNAGAGPSSTIGSAPAAGTPGSGGGSGPGAVDANTATPNGSAQNVEAGASAQQRPSASAGTAVGAEARPVEDGILSGQGPVVYILGAIAAITAFGAFVLLLWRRGDDDDDMRAPLPAAGPAARRTLTPRSLRRGRQEQANDPILESMGLNEGTDSSKLAVSASQVHRGPGVRDPQPRRR